MLANLPYSRLFHKVDFQFGDVVHRLIFQSFREALRLRQRTESYLTLPHELIVIEITAATILVSPTPFQHIHDIALACVIAC